MFILQMKKQRLRGDMGWSETTGQGQGLKSALSGSKAHTPSCKSDHLNFKYLGSSDLFSSWSQHNQLLIALPLAPQAWLGASSAENE